MDVQNQIKNYINSVPEPKSSELLELHNMFVKLMPKAQQWFLDGRDSENKIISNPNIGYGVYTINYANGTSREFYQIGLSANTGGISVYLMGIKDKNYLKETFSKQIGKAIISGYCIKFKTLKDINTDTLKEAVKYGLQATA